MTKEDVLVLKIGWVEEKLIGMTDTFYVYIEGKGGFDVMALLKPDPTFSGDFLDRNFVCRHGSTNEVVARVSEKLGEFNHYQVQVALGEYTFLLATKEGAKMVEKVRDDDLNHSDQKDGEYTKEY